METADPGPMECAESRLGPALAGAFLGLLAACTAGEGPGPGTPETGPQILSLDAPTPALVGSPIEVGTAAADLLGPDPHLHIDGLGGAHVELAPEGAQEGALRTFPITHAVLDALGPGTHEVTLRLTGEGRETRGMPWRLTLARDLPVRLDGAPGGNVHRNDRVTLSGDGFVSETEGHVEAVFEGQFRPDDGGPTRRVTARLPVVPVERFQRDRGQLVLTTGLGGAAPGTFEGTLTLESALLGGGSSASAPRTTRLHFGPPELFEPIPSTVSLEQYLHFHGAGFLGGEDGVTVVHLGGTFDTGTRAEAFVADVVPRFVSGGVLQLRMEALSDAGRLISALFGEPEGVFRGDAQVRVVTGEQEVVSSITPIEITLGPVRQVVWLRFLPSFYDTLPRFGLGAAVGQVEPLVAQRIETIFDRWAVDVRLERPTDFSPNGYATIDIGGTDPNGRDLIGLDPTPDKDVDNLRLYDVVGGASAESADGGSEIFGGVFVESYLFFSASPGLGRARPSFIDADPLFDEIFEPVRREPATAVEASAAGGRVDVVARAIEAFASLVGETAAHELGHTLGLANPYGAGAHNDTDDAGCLMDAGPGRPFRERAGLEPVRICHDHPAYLDTILGPR